MKKLLFIFALFASFVSVGQTPSGYTNFNSRNYWEAGLFRALGVPAGDSAQFRTGQAQWYGALYADSTDNNTPAGLYQWNGLSWVIVGGSTAVNLPDDVVIGRSVTWEGGFKFHVQEGIVRIDNQLYTLDSITLTLDSADLTYDRFDRIYDDITGAHVLEGVPADPAAIPQLQGGQIGLTTILIEVGATNPAVSSIIVYQENDATITPTGTTVVGNATANPFVGTYHIRITTINNGDIVDIIKTSGTWDISQVTSLALHIRNRAVVPQLANVRVSLWNGSSTGSQVSGEVILTYNKNNTASYMAVSIPISAFGQITNTNIDRIRLRYTSNNATNHTGFDLDNIEFQQGIEQPGNGSTGQFTLAVPSSMTLSPSNTIVTNNTPYTLSFNGTSSQYVRGDGSLATFSAVTTVGAFGSQASNSNGSVISGSTIYFQPVTSSNPGMTTSTMKAKWDSTYYVENISSLGDSLLTPITVDRLGIKSIVAGSNITLTDTDSTIVIAAGAGGSARFGYSGEDDTGGENRSFEFDANTLTFNILGEFAPGEGQYISFYDATNIRIGSNAGGLDAYANFSGGVLTLHSDLFQYVIDNVADSSGAGTHYMLAWNAADGTVVKMDLPTGGGGGGSGTVNTGAANRLAYYTGSGTTVDDLAAITADRALVSDANGLPVAANPSTTEINFVDGVTSAIQTQLDGKANLALSNLASVAINTDLVSDADNTDNLGSPANAWKDGYLRRLLLDGSTSGTTELYSDATAKTIRGVTLSGEGIVTSKMFARLTSDFTLANNNSDQVAFSSALDTWTLPANTLYWVEGEYITTHAATSHSVAVGFTLAGGASATAVSYSGITWTANANANTSTQQTVYITQTASTVTNTAGANAIEIIKFSGFISTNAAGTWQPIIKFSADPTGTILMKAGTYITFTAMGTDTTQSVGSVN